MIKKIKIICSIVLVVITLIVFFIGMFITQRATYEWYPKRKARQIERIIQELNDNEMVKDELKEMLEDD